MLNDRENGEKRTVTSIGKNVETPESLVYRLKKRAEIRRSITTRRSVQEGKPDRLADLLDEAADKLIELGYTNDK